MPKLAGTFVSTEAKGNREDLSDLVSRITPEDTPIYSMAGSGKAEATFSEWEVDDLATPAANVNAEGDEFAFTAIAPPERQGNHTQIFRKQFIMSETQKAVKNAGQLEKINKQKLKKSIEIRKDAEFSILSNVASVGGETRVQGGLPSWLKTNVSRGAGGANGGYNTGTKLTVAATNGTQRAFTKGLLDNVLQQVFNSGGTAKYLSVSPYVKTVFSSFMSDPAVANLRLEASKSGKNTLVGSVDIYKGDFDTVALVANRVQTTAALARNAFILDPSILSKLSLRKIQHVKDIAKTGDAEKNVVIGEMTLKVANEKGLGIIADLFGVNAST